MMEMPLARVLAAAAMTSFSRMYWMFSSIVVTMFAPGAAGCSMLLKLRPRVHVSLADLGDPDFVLSMVVEKGALVFSLTDVDRPLRHLDIFLSRSLPLSATSHQSSSILLGTELLWA